MEHNAWFEKVTQDSVRKAAKYVGLTHRTLAYQLEKGSLSPENVIAIAIAYGHHPVGALVDTGYLDEKWAQQIDPAHTLRMATEDQLADEVLRRMKLGQAHGALDTPIDELTERRSKKSNKTTPTVQDAQYDPHKHAAYSGPDEDALRQQQEGAEFIDDDDYIP